MLESAANSTKVCSSRSNVSIPSRIIPDPNQTYDDGDESPHVWGFTDTKYQITQDGSVEITGSRYPTSGQKLDGLLPWFEKLMNVKFPREQRMPTNPAPTMLPNPVQNDEFLLKVREFMVENQINSEPLQRLRHGHGHSLDDMYTVNYGGHFKRIPDLVLFPENTEQVLAIVSAARDSGVRLIPFGGGTNVSGALSCPADERRTIAAVSTRRMNRVLWIEKFNRLARIEAGAVGRNIAATLAAHGMMLGHEPDSMEFSTLGGWIATKASGMKKSQYGNIEDIVLDVEVATQNGLLARVSDNLPPRESIGLDLNSLIFGSEGTMGIVTSAVVKIFPLPDLQRYGSIIFRSYDLGLAFMYDLTQSGNSLPASVRLVDNTQFQFSMALKPLKSTHAIRSRLEKAYVTRFRGFDPQSMAACTLAFEGSASQVRAQESAVYKIARQHGGMKAGGANGRRGFEMTFAIAYIRDFAMSLGVLAESFETSCSWSLVPELCRRVHQRVKDEHAALRLPGEPFVSSRISQIYHTGVTVYFYLAVFTGFGTVVDPVGAYEVLETAARDEILKSGGSLSHHHGVGTVRRRFLPKVLSAAASAHRKCIAAAQDPENIFIAREVEVCVA
jgi:alkyldihydroxyacetonephosphate synthase